MMKFRGHLRQKLALMTAGVLASCGIAVGGATPASAAVNCQGSMMSGSQLTACQGVVYKARQLGVLAQFGPVNGFTLADYAHGYCNDLSRYGFAEAQKRLTHNFGQRKGQAVGYGGTRVCR